MPKMPPDYDLKKHLANRRSLSEVRAANKSKSSPENVFELRKRPDKDPVAAIQTPEGKKTP